MPLAHGREHLVDFVREGIAGNDAGRSSNPRWRRLTEGLTINPTAKPEVSRRMVQRPMMSENEVIIELGAEGGSVTLYGIRTDRGWFFSRNVIDSGDVLIDDGPIIQHKSAIVDSWTAALELLDRYPWATLYPISIHPDFKQMLLAARQERLPKDTETKTLDAGDFDAAVRNWREAYGHR
jgi:hypothetical protein